MVSTIKLFRSIILAIIGGMIAFSPRISADNPAFFSGITEIDDKIKSKKILSTSKNINNNNDEEFNPAALTAANVAYRFLITENPQPITEFEPKELNINDQLKNDPKMKKMLEYYEQITDQLKEIRQSWNQKSKELNKLIGNLQSKKFLTIGVKEDGSYVILDNLKKNYNGILYKISQNGIQRKTGVDTKGNLIWEEVQTSFKPSPTFKRSATI